MSNNTLHTKYRPDRLEDVIGQGSVVRSLGEILKRDGSHAFIFSGPSGTGKTTLARIAAVEVGCDPMMLDNSEINGAKYTGVDDMRTVLDTLHYLPLRGKVRPVIVDECHMLSRNAWNSILKLVEEPPPHVYWFFCTTEAGKVPPTIKTRCTSFVLKPVSEGDLGKLVDRVCKAEKIKLPSDIRSVILAEADGSPRQALVNLEVCRGATDRKEAAEALRSAHESPGAIELCRFLVKGGSWLSAMKIVAALAEENPESVRIVTMNYVAAVAKKEGKPERFLNIMEAFSTPFNASEKQAPLILAIGRVMFGH